MLVNSAIKKTVHQINSTLIAIICAYCYPMHPTIVECLNKWNTPIDFNPCPCTGSCNPFASANCFFSIFCTAFTILSFNILFSDVSYSLTRIVVSHLYYYYQRLCEIFKSLKLDKNNSVINNNFFHLILTNCNFRTFFKFRNTTFKWFYHLFLSFLNTNWLKVFTFSGRDIGGFDLIFTILELGIYWWSLCRGF